MNQINIGIEIQNNEHFSKFLQLLNLSFPDSIIFELSSFIQNVKQAPDVIFLAGDTLINSQIILNLAAQYPETALIFLFSRDNSLPETLKSEGTIDDILQFSELTPYLIVKSVEYSLAKRALNRQLRQMASSLASEVPLIDLKKSDVNYRSLEELLTHTDSILDRNIKDLRRFVEELKNSYHRIQMVMDNSSDCFIELDTDLRIINLNKNAQQYYQMFFGRTFRIGDFILDHVSEARLHDIRLVYNEVLAGNKKILKFEVADQGLQRTFKMKYLPVKNLDGNITSITFIAEEITSEENSLKGMIRRQEELLEAERNYRDLFEKSNEGIIIHDEATGSILDINQNACNIIKTTKQAVLSGSVDIFGHHKKGYRFSDAIKEQKKNAVNGKQSFDWEALRSDGSHCWLEVSLFPTDIGGKKRILVFIRDINERKKNEERTKLALSEKNKVLNASLDVICSIDSEGKFVMVSKASEDVWGYTPQELIGRKYIDLVFAEDREKTNKIAEQITEGLSVRSFENRYIRKDGSLVFIIWSAKWDVEDNLMYCTAKDASRKKQLEFALEHERLRYRTIFNKAPAVIAMLRGEDHSFVMANPLYMKLSGKTSLVGLTVKEAFPEVESQGFISLLDHVYNSGMPYEAREAPVHIKNGDSSREFYLDFIYQPYEDAHKNIEGVFFFGIDVTEKVLTRRKIKENEERYKQIVETAQEGIWTWNHAGIVTFCNKKLCELLEYSEQEIIGKHYTRFMNRSEHQFASRYFAEVAKGAKKRCELKYRTKSGGVIWAHVAGSAIHESGKFFGTMAMVSDVTIRKLAEDKLKKSEANLNSIIDSTNVAYTLLDKDLKIVLFNQSAYNGTLKEQGKKLEMGRHIKEYAPVERVGDIDKIYGKVLQGETLSSTVSFKNDEQTSYYSLKLYPVSSSDNTILGVLIAMDDITERKQAEDLLEKQNKELRKANEELDRFVYSASHDLRAPLASILGLLDVAKIENQVEQLKGINKMVYMSVTKLDSFVRDIIDYSRNARLELSVERIDFKELIDESVEQLHYMEAASSIDIRTKINGQSEFRSDKKRIRVIINNLLSNAIKYHNIRQAHPYIQFTITLSNRNAVIEIKDNGNGIAPASLNKIFNMFYRGSENSTGSGLGLYIVKEIVEKLSGTMGVQSTLSEGTTFQIQLPAAGTETSPK
ncbi:MAG: domain S-box [Bacteroidota bacterium]|jgi:PAS domain S-box-containing protein|nr:domain S-box [Bacteroidota bacterium]